MAFFKAYDVGEPPDTFSCTHCAQVSLIFVQNLHCGSWERRWYIKSKAKVVEEKGGLRICENEEEHRRQWDETEKTREEVMLMLMLIMALS